jgi:hypothetical protein
MTNDDNEKNLNTFLSKNVSSYDIERNIKICHDVTSLCANLSTIDEDKIDPMLQVSLIKLREIIDKKIN